MVCEPCQKKHWRKVKNPEMLLERYEPDYTEVLIEEDAQRWERDLRDHGSDPEDQSWEDMIGGECDEYFVDGSQGKAHDVAARVADYYAREWTRTDEEYRFLVALSVGHTLAEARRISGLRIHQARHLIDRLRKTYPWQ